MSEDESTEFGPHFDSVCEAVAPIISNLLDQDPTRFRSDHTLMWMTLCTIGTFVVNVAASVTGNNVPTIRQLLRKERVTRGDLEEFEAAIRKCHIDATHLEKRDKLKAAIADQLPDVFRSKKRVTDDIVEAVFAVLKKE